MWIQHGRARDKVHDSFDPKEGPSERVSLLSLFYVLEYFLRKTIESASYQFFLFNVRWNGNLLRISRGA
jgi:hypothetical protein